MRSAPKPVHQLPKSICPIADPAIPPSIPVKNGCDDKKPVGAGGSAAAHEGNADHDGNAVVVGCGDGVTVFWIGFVAVVVVVCSLVYDPLLPALMGALELCDMVAPARASDTSERERVKITIIIKAITIRVLVYIGRRE